MITKPTTKFIHLPEAERDSLLLIVETFLMKDPWFYGRMKYQETLVTFLDLFEQGILKFSVDEEMTRFSLLMYDPDQDDYVKPQESSIARYLKGGANGNRAK